MTAPHEYFRLTCLTPVHIGTGVEYVGGVDFIARGGNTYLLDSERVLEKLYAIGQLPRDPGDLKSKVERMFERERPEDYALARCSGAVGGDLKVRAAIRAGDGRPLMPGSSIKGALRTLLFVARIGIDGPHSQIKPEFTLQLGEAARTAVPLRKRVAQPLENRIFRSSLREEFASLKESDAKADLLRMLSLSDAAFSSDSTQPFVTAAAGTARQTTVAVEALKHGSQSLLRVHLEFPGSERFFAESLPPWEKLAEWSCRHALHLLKTDCDYFSSGNAGRRDCSQALERLEELKARVNEAPAGTLFLRLGWGTGWRTMTGDVLLTPEQRKIPLPKSGDFGPKTRKVIVKDSSQSAPAISVLGWISLTPISKTEALQLEAAIRPPVRSVPVPTADTSTPENAPLSIDEFRLAVDKLQAKDWGRLGDFYLRALADAALKEARLAALGARIAQVWNGDKRRLQEAARKFPALVPYLRTQ